MAESNRTVPVRCGPDEVVVVFSKRQAQTVRYALMHCKPPKEITAEKGKQMLDSADMRVLVEFAKMKIRVEDTWPEEDRYGG